MYAMVIVRYRRPIEEVLAQQEAHRAFLRKLKEEGTLLAAGPNEPRFGGMFLVRVPDLPAPMPMNARWTLPCINCSAASNVPPTTRLVASNTPRNAGVSPASR